MVSNKHRTNLVNLQCILKLLLVYICMKIRISCENDGENLILIFFAAKCSENENY